MFYKKIIESILLAIYLSVPAFADSTLPTIDASFISQQSFVRELSEHLVLKGKSFDLATVQELSEQQRLEIFGLLNDAFQREVKPTQVTKIKDVVQKIFEKQGYAHVSVSMQEMIGGAKLLADLGKDFKASGVNLLKNKKLINEIDRAFAERKITAAGAALRNAHAQHEDLLAKITFDPLMNDQVAVDQKVKEEPQSQDVIKLVNHAVPMIGAAKETSEQTISSDLQKSLEEDLKDSVAEDLVPSATGIEVKTADNSITEQQVASAVSSIGNYAKAFLDATDKEGYVLNTANSYVGGKLNSGINDLLEMYEGVNSEISLGLTDLSRVEPSGKLLLPLYNSPKTFVFTQLGLTSSSGDRELFHAGFGVRHYPEAESKVDLGSYMYGLNAVFDFDLTRGHKRMSLGGEFANSYMMLSGNFYTRLSGWRGSHDFERDYVQERPANGWDLKTKFFLSNDLGIGQLSANADVTHWIGKDIAPFGSTTNAEDLEDSPWIFGLGLEWRPVPAISLGVKHSFTTGGQHNNEIALNFSVPLGEYELKNAFNPNAVNMASGMDLKSTRSAFINRDYTMPLQYRATPGKYHIIYVGQTGTDKFRFRVVDGLNRPGAFLPVEVKTAHECVILSNDGHYTSDAMGYFVVEVISSCRTNTTLHITVQATTEDFDISIKNVKFDLSAKPTEIFHDRTSLITLEMGDKSDGTPVEWKLSGNGTLENETNEIVDKKAYVTYHSAASGSTDEVAVITATIYGIEKSVEVTVVTGNADPGNDIVSESDENAIEGNEIIALSFDNLEIGQDVQWTVDGEAQIAEEKTVVNGMLANKRKSLRMAVSRGGVSTLALDANAGENIKGSSTIYLQGDDVENATAKVTAEILDPDTNASSGTKTIDIGVASYVAEVAELPALAEPGDKFTVKISKLKYEANCEGETCTVKWNEVPYTTREAETSQVQSDGTASMTYTVSETAVTDGSTEAIKIEGITANYYRNVTERSEITLDAIPVHDYDPAISVVASEAAPATILSFDTFSDGDIVALDFSTGKHDFPVVWKLEDGTEGYFVDSDGNSIGTEITVNYDDSGVSRVFFKGTRAEGSTNETVKISATGMGKTKYLDSSSAGNIKYHTWSEPVFTLGTESLEYKTTRVITLSSLKPNSKVEFKVASVENGEDADPVTLTETEVTADENGNASTTVNGVTDFAVTSFTVDALVHESTQTVKNFSDLKPNDTRTINMLEHNLEVNVPRALTGYVNGAQYASGNTSEENIDVMTVTLTDGIVNDSTPETVTWTLKEGSTASFSKTEDVKSITSKFLADGTAEVQVYAQKPFNVESEITAATMKQRPSTNANLQKTVAYNIDTLDGTVNLPTLTQGTSYTDDIGAAAVFPYETMLATVDYNTASKFTVSGLLKYSSASASVGGTDLGMLKDEDGDGEITFEVPAMNTDGIVNPNDNGTVTPYEVIVKSVKMSAAGYEEVTKTETLNMRQYPLTQTADKTEIYGDESFVDTISGARPGSEITLSIEGDGELSATSCTADDTGKCEVTVTGKSPYTTSIQISASGL